MSALDIRSLGQAIAAALHERIGDSDSEQDCEEMRRDGAGFGASRGPPQQHLRAYSAPQARPAQSGLVIGAGPASNLVATADSSGMRPGTASFVLEGIHPDATDAQVRNLVWPLVGNLHDFQRLARHSGVAAGSKAYRIEVDAADSGRLLNPTSWPAGLRVRPWTEKQKKRRTFPATLLAPGPRQQQQQQQQPYSVEGGDGRPQRGHWASAAPQQQQQQFHSGEGGDGRPQRGYWASAAPQQQQQQQSHSGEGGDGRPQRGHWASAAPQQQQQQQQSHSGEGGGGRPQRGHWPSATPQQQQSHSGEGGDGRPQRGHWAFSRAPAAAVSLW